MTESELAAFAEQSEQIRGQLATVMDAFWRGVGLVPPSERPYLGARCGWYPEKPKRRRRRP